MIFLGFRNSFGAGFRMEVQNFYIEKSSAELASPDSICAEVLTIFKTFLLEKLSFQFRFHCIYRMLIVFQ